MIEARNCLNEDVVKMFVDKVTDDDIILVVVGNAEICTCTKAELRSTFTENADLRNAVLACTTKTDILFATENEVLATTNEDYNYWNENTRRVNKLFKHMDAAAAEPIEERIVACAIRTDEGKFEDIVTCKTLVKSTMVTFFNAEIRRKLIKSYMKANVVFCMSYDDASEDNQWFTFDELIDKGIVTV